MDLKVTFLRDCNDYFHVQTYFLKNNHFLIILSILKSNTPENCTQHIKRKFLIG